MTYAAYEDSVHAGSAIFLFEFTQNAQTWRYTARAANITALGHTWEAAPVEVSGLEQTNELNKNTVSLTFPVDHPFAALFLAYSQESVTSVTIRRGHHGDPDGEFAVHWKGRVASSDATGNKIKLDCESIFTSLRRPGLRARYQRTCRHVLYGSGCGIDKAAHATEAPAGSVNGTVLTCAAAAAQADGWYTGGMVGTPDGGLRFVLRHVGASLLLSRPVSPAVAHDIANSGYGMNYGNLYGGVPVTLYPGCDHSRATCISKFNNRPNYGGFDDIPSKNPMGGSSIV